MNRFTEKQIKILPHRPGNSAKFYLGKKGKEALFDLTDLTENEIHCPSNKIQSESQDQKHRTGIIDLQISLDLYKESNNVELMFCDRYFDTVGNNRVEKNLKSKTAIQYENTSIKADMVFKINTEYQEELYIVELENGKDKKKSITKCKEHAMLLYSGNVHDRYEYKKGYRTLWIFEHASTMKSTLIALQEDSYFENASEYFLFNTIENAKTNFFTNWINLKNFDRKLFYL